MDASNHKEGNRYTYKCEKCGYDRGILDHEWYSASCPECGTWYTRTKIPKEGDRRTKPLKPYSLATLEGLEGIPETETYANGEWV